MSLKVTILISVKDSEHDRYNDPSGSESVDLYCVDIKDIESSVYSVAGALLRVAHLKFVAEVAEKGQEE